MTEWTSKYWLCDAPRREAALPSPKEIAALGYHTRPFLGRAHDNLWNWPHKIASPAAYFARRISIWPPKCS